MQGEFHFKNGNCISKIHPNNSRTQTTVFDTGGEECKGGRATGGRYDSLPYLFVGRGMKTLGVKAGKTSFNKYLPKDHKPM